MVHKWSVIQLGDVRKGGRGCMGFGLRGGWKKGREEKRKGEETGQVGRGEKRIGHLQGE